jgi:fibronectin-binding autotransporter adhesin
MDLRNGFLQVYNSEGVSGSLSVTGSSTLSGSLNVFGSASFGATITGSLTVSGSSRIIGSQTITGSLTTSGSLNVLGSGSIALQGTLNVTGSQYTSGSTDVTTIQGSTAGGTLFNVLGTSGQLFTVTDGLSGSLFSVNTISGLPLVEVFSDETINIGKFGFNPLRTSGSVAIVSGSMTGSFTGNATLPVIFGPTVASGSSNVLSVQGSGLEATIFDVNGPSGQLFSVVDGLSGSLFSVNTISGLPVMEVFSDASIRLGQYSNPILSLTTTSASLNGALAVTSGTVTVTSGSVIITKSGSGASDPIFDVEGAQGQLFSVLDSFQGSLMSVNDISGFPILDVRSDDTVTMGTFGSNALVVSQSNVIIGVTASSAPTYTGRDGEVKFGVAGSNYVMYVYLAGKWRSGSLSA